MGISEHVVGRTCSVYGPLNGNVRVTHSSLFIMANWTMHYEMSANLIRHRHLGRASSTYHLHP